MPYRFKPKESVPEGLKRIAAERMDKAIAQLTQPEDEAKAVHNARKRFKQVRAVLRLAKAELGQTYQRENDCFRDLGHRLSDIRDAQVRLNTLDSLSEHYAIATDAFADIRTALEAYYQSTRQFVVAEENAIAAALPKLKAARERVAGWPIEANGWKALSGFERAYQRGQNAFKQAIKHPEAENWHDWRKRVKDLWYHTKILKPVWPGMMTALANELSDLSDLLGDDHDLVGLREFILSRPKRLKECDQQDALLALIDRRQQELRTEAQKLGQRLYVEKPKRFDKRTKAYWQIWRQQAQPAAEPKRELVLQ
ncbi:CHAD domain-containing protein [Romeria aff. gracilis LEGE 07310]|uniref:CHAD domain-containing protein n=1 Tax=Vasconcelosia minhoensis LEGE 07310 TaxID=915328 RepID=A0A8J7DM82_9CYAN|nr:CHAD domain-containing protein [Romeria gracilis]MBE9078366.1 CHAD domain-containing protein [Romeria aff. gracilis LEGE 07310]